MYISDKNEAVKLLNALYVFSQIEADEDIKSQMEDVIFEAVDDFDSSVVFNEKLGVYEAKDY